MDWDHTEVKKARLRAKKSQQEVADHTGVTRGAVAQWEAGITRPRPEKLEQLKNFVGLDVTKVMKTIFQSRPGDHAPLVRELASAAQILQAVNSLAEQRIGIKISPAQTLQWLVKEAGLDAEIFGPDEASPPERFEEALR